MGPPFSPYGNQQRLVPSVWAYSSRAVLTVSSGCVIGSDPPSVPVSRVKLSFVSAHNDDSFRALRVRHDHGIILELFLGMTFSQKHTLYKLRTTSKLPGERSAHTTCLASCKPSYGCWLQCMDSRHRSNSFRSLNQNSSTVSVRIESSARVGHEVGGATGGMEEQSPRRGLNRSALPNCCAPSR